MEALKLRCDYLPKLLDHNMLRRSNFVLLFFVLICVTYVTFFEGLCIGSTKDEDFWSDVRSLADSNKDMPWTPINRGNSESIDVSTSSKPADNKLEKIESAFSKKQVSVAPPQSIVDDNVKEVNTALKNKSQDGAKFLPPPTLESLTTLQQKSQNSDTTKQQEKSLALPEKFSDPVAPIAPAPSASKEIASDVTIPSVVDGSADKIQSITPAEQINNVSKIDSNRKDKNVLSNSSSIAVPDKTKNAKNADGLSKNAESENSKKEKVVEKNVASKPLKINKISNESDAKKSLPKKENSGSTKDITNVDDKNNGTAKKKHSITHKKEYLVVPGFNARVPDFDEETHSMDLDINTRQPYDYRKQPLPPSISKKQYNRQNQHLPKAFYQSEYSSLLFIAVQSSDIGAIQALLAKGADINAQDASNGYTPLMYAIVYNKFDAFRYLMMSGADVSITTLDGRTALHIAAIYNRVDMFKMLISIGANIFAMDNAGLTPYESSGEMYEEIAMVLASQYDDINQALLDCTFIGANTCVVQILKKGANVNYSSRHGDTALTIAMNRKNIDLIAILIANGADLNQRGIGGLTAKDLAHAIGDQQIINVVETAIVQKELKDIQ